MDYGSESQPVSASSTPVNPLSATPARSGGRWLVLSLVVLIILAGLVWWWLSRPDELPGSLGFTNRAAVTTPTYLDQEMSVAGTCLSSYILQTGGRNETGVQTYLLTLNLVSEPTTDQALAKELASENCQTETTTILDTIAKDLGLGASADTELLTTSYRTKSGHRFLLP